MYSKLFPYEEQTWNCQEKFRSRMIAYGPEINVMEWTFFETGHVVPMHEHYHVQVTYIVKGGAKLILHDGSEKVTKAGDAVYFAPNELHSVVTTEPNTVIIDVFTPIRLDHVANHSKAAPETVPAYEP